MVADYKSETKGSTTNAPLCSGMPNALPSGRAHNELRSGCRRSAHSNMPNVPTTYSKARLQVAVSHLRLGPRQPNTSLNKRRHFGATMGRVASPLPTKVGGLRPTTDHTSPRTQAAICRPTTSHRHGQALPEHEWTRPGWGAKARLEHQTYKTGCARDKSNPTEPPSEKKLPPKGPPKFGHIGANQAGKALEALTFAP